MPSSRSAASTWLVRRRRRRRRTGWPQGCSRHRSGQRHQACAGFWPRLPGWHLLRDGERGTAFHVRASDDAPGLQAAALREATQGLSTAGHPPTSAIAATPGRRWPWFGWLLLTAALWWFERSRIGAARSTATASGA